MFSSSGMELNVLKSHPIIKASKADRDGLFTELEKQIATVHHLTATQQKAMTIFCNI